MNVSRGMIIRIAVVTVMAASVAAIDPATAQADVNAKTDDAHVSKPTGWWVYRARTVQQVKDLISSKGARLTDIEPANASATLWDIVLVKNSGPYAINGWWWYVGRTAGQVKNLLAQKKGRLIHLQPYRIGGKTRFALVMVKNTGSQARTWYWGYGKSAASIKNHLKAKGTRLIDLETYYTGSGKRYAFVSIRNTAGDKNPWYWWLNQTNSSLSSKLKQKKARLIDLERLPNGKLNAVATKPGQPSDKASWWWYRFSSMGALVNFANQLAARPIDIERYKTGSGKTRFAAVFIDNANAETRRIRKIFGKGMLDSSGAPTRGIFEAYLREVDTSTKISLNAGRVADVASSLKALHLLHAMRSVQAGEDLNSPFVYYDYPNSPFNANTKDACPLPADEVNANKRTNYDLETGLDEMMSISDNRTTRGVVLRYGGFGPLNTTASMFGLSKTELRHNIGCSSYNVNTNKYVDSLANRTTARDLARLYETVWAGDSLTDVPRAEFLESANPGGSNDAIDAIIDDEAAKLGLAQSVADEFSDNVVRYGKGGSYNTCLAGPNGGCGTAIMVRSGAGIIRLPVKNEIDRIVHRTFVFARFISQAPRPCTACTDAYSEAANELYRTQIRSALKTWE